MLNFSSFFTFSIENELSQEQAITQQIETFASTLHNAHYTDPSSFIYAPFDQTYIDNIQQLSSRYKNSIAAMVVVGIGGSNLGARAVHQLLCGSFSAHDQLPIYWADTVDTDYITALCAQVKIHLQKGEHILVVIISKSGATTETIANGQIILDLLMHYNATDYADSVMVITDDQSALWHWARQENIQTLEIPKQIGGRYSIFTPAGLFPLAVAGIDIVQLCKGAQEITPICLQDNSATNISLHRALIVYNAYIQGYVIHDFFAASVDAENIGKWYRQLMAESLGKQKTDGQRIGITPTVSICSTDLHSMVQLNLAGPRNKITTFLQIPPTHTLTITPSPLSALVENVADHSFENVMHAIMRGAMQAYQAEQLPYMHITVPEKSAYYVGQLLQMLMIEIVYLGTLLQVNPFDQPAVELYKKSTRKLLSK